MVDFAELAEELVETEILHEMIPYSGGPHAFTVFESLDITKMQIEKHGIDLLSF